MKILIDIGHPAHVHLFKYLANELGGKHKIYFSVRDIPVAKHLMDHYNMRYVDLGKKKDSLFGKFITVVVQNIKILFFVLKNGIDVGLSSGIILPHVSIITKMKSITFDDDDDLVEPLIVKYAHPFSDVILTPSPIIRQSHKSLNYSGTHELAYLHPNRFAPDNTVLDELGLTHEQPYFIVRFVAFKGHHDVGHSGISLKNKRSLITLLNKFGRVIITSEREIEPEFEQYRLAISPEKIHSVMNYATLFIGDSQTMTSEAAVLGIPAFKCNTFAGKLSVPNELEYKYNLCHSFAPHDFDKMLIAIEKTLNSKIITKTYQERRKKMLSDKIDVTAFFTWFIENYPESINIMKENPDYQYQFK
ncbi:MAG: DUF354 domain-containing protein [Bacteroidales bacterium]